MEYLKPANEALEVVSKPQIVFEGKAQAESKTQHTQHGVVYEHFNSACNAAIGH
jgi:hypothetical protein